MAIDTNFLTDYQGIGRESQTGLAVNQVGSIALGIGIFRCYLNNTANTLNVGDHGVSRWFALTVLQSVGIESFKDREIPDYTSSLPWAGQSTGSSFANGITFSAGTTIYGDFTNMKLASGTILEYGI